jgi:hypothetical protein
VLGGRSLVGVLGVIVVGHGATGVVVEAETVEGV